MTKTWL